MARTGRTRAEREAQRQLYLARALVTAAQMGVTLRCRRVIGDLASPQHKICRGEGPGGAGCLCRCHDPAEDSGEAGPRDQG
jgi:hypothetical protein